MAGLVFLQLLEGLKPIQTVAMKLGLAEGHSFKSDAKVIDCLEPLVNTDIRRCREQFLAVVRGKSDAN